MKTQNGLTRLKLMSRSLFFKVMSEGPPIISTFWTVTACCN